MMIRFATVALLGITLNFAVFATPLRAQQLVFVEPDDYGRGAVISRAVPGVTLSVEGRSAADPEITTIALGIGRASTGEFAFGYHRADGSSGFTWRDDSVTQAFFIADFDTPTAFVAIDIVRGGGPGDTADPAVLTAFDIDGNLLETVRTLGGLADFETLLVTHPRAEISTVRVTGVRDPIVLDNFRFELDGELPPPSCQDRLQTCEAERVDILGELGSCEADLSDALSLLEECELRPELPDGDGDGEHDLTDRCPGTPIGEPVDDAGCSLMQFCQARSHGEPAICNNSDWGNDEPRGNARDCHAVRARGRQSSCEP